MEWLKQISDNDYTIECSYIHTVTVLSDGTKIIKLDAYDINEMGNEQIDSQFESIAYISTEYMISKRIKHKNEWFVYTDLDTITDEMMYQIDIRIAMEGF